jgi:hypothetical protein
MNALRTAGGSAWLSAADACETQVGDSSHDTFCEAEAIAIPGHSEEYYKGVLQTMRSTNKAALREMYAPQRARHGRVPA